MKGWTTESGGSIRNQKKNPMSWKLRIWVSKALENWEKMSDKETTKTGSKRERRMLKKQKNGGWERIGAFLIISWNNFFFFYQVFVNHKGTTLSVLSCTKSSSTECLQPVGWSTETRKPWGLMHLKWILALIFSFSMIKQYLTFSLTDLEMSRIASRLQPVPSVHKTQALKTRKDFTFFPRALHRKDISKNNAYRIRK